jgi:hypothetical protein
MSYGNGITNKKRAVAGDHPHQAITTISVRAISEHPSVCIVEAGGDQVTRYRDAGPEAFRIDPGDILLRHACDVHTDRYHKDDDQRTRVFCAFNRLQVEYSDWAVAGVAASSYNPLRAATVQSGDLGAADLVDCVVNGMMDITLAGWLENESGDTAVKNGDIAIVVQPTAVEYNTHMLQYVDEKDRVVQRERPIVVALKNTLNNGTLAAWYEHQTEQLRTYVATQTRDECARWETDRANRGGGGGALSAHEIRERNEHADVAVMQLLLGGSEALRACGVEFEAYFTRGAKSGASLLAHEFKAVYNKQMHRVHCHAGMSCKQTALKRVITSLVYISFITQRAMIWQATVTAPAAGAAPHPFARATGANDATLTEALMFVQTATAKALMSCYEAYKRELARRTVGIFRSSGRPGDKVQLQVAIGSCITG